MKAISLFTPGLTTLESASSNGAEGFDTGERGLGSGHRLDPPHGTQSLLQCGMITLDPIVYILAVNVADGIFRPVLVVVLADHLCIAVCLVGDDRKRLIAPHGLSRLSQKCPCCLGIAPRRQAEIDQLAELIHGPPKVAPAPAHANVGLIGMPLKPSPGAVPGLGPIPDFGAKVLHPPVNGRGIN